MIINVVSYTYKKCSSVSAGEFFYVQIFLPLAIKVFGILELHKLETDFNIDFQFKTK